MTLKLESLVLYKSRPAIVRQLTDKKLTIEFADESRTSVRPKDVTLLHPGPSPHPRQLKIPIGDPQTAWELLAGSETTLAELSALAFGEYTPAAAWTTWQLVTEGTYFDGTPEAVIAHSPGKVEEIVAARELKAAEEREWSDFVARVAKGSYALDDERYLVDVIALALGRVDSSRTLRQFGRPQTPEAAHQLLLEIGRWLPADNPYPARAGIITGQPNVAVDPLVDEPRRDLTHLRALAIDDEGSTDPDDAVSLDGERLWVHVADVAAMVRADSPADEEARGRAANLYLPEGIVRMLPDELTDKLALGLQPLSPALSFALAPHADGDFTLLEIVPSWVRVERTTYEAVETQLQTSPYRELLAIADSRRARRLAGGAIEIELPEVKIKAAVDGTVSIKSLPPLRSRTLVREAMLVVGEATGRLAQAHDIPMAYTAQDAPFDSNSPADLTNASPSVMWAKRRQMQRSRPTTTPGRHTGLGLDIYVQVTSPLRRYLDLLAHQQLRAYLRGEPPLDKAAVTLRIGLTDAVAGAVRATERLSNQHWTLAYLMQHSDWQGEGVVVENKPGRDIVLIPDLAWETEIYHRPARPLDSTITLAVESIDLAHRTARFKVL
ncbi:MAG: RNB domain-containing ribonuclease [Chloroflexota bacterium]